MCVCYRHDYFMYSTEYIHMPTHSVRGSIVYMCTLECRHMSFEYFKIFTVTLTV